MTEFTSRSVAEPVPLAALVGRWDARLSSGRQAWTRNRLVTGWRRDALSLAYVQRYDYAMRFSEDTAELYWRDRNDQPLPAGRTYDVQLRARHLRAQGVRFGWHHQVSGGWYAESYLHLLQGQSFQDGRLSGQLAAGGQLYTGDAIITYRYSDDKLLDHDFPSPAGQGLAADVRIGWRGERFAAELDIQDLWSVMRWQDAPFTLGTLNTEGRAGEGLSLQPLLSGRRGGSNYTQSFPHYSRFMLADRRPGWQPQLAGEYFQDRLLLQPGLARSFLWGTVSTGYEMRYRQWLVGIADRDNRWRVQVGTDRFRTEEARSLTLAITLAIPF
ncbi:MAG: hypothetical protein LAT61_11290 [Alcanivorax sp.]|nr:hypothetical protein [Alcanivorax sp.]